MIKREKVILVDYQDTDLPEKIINIIRKFIIYFEWKNDSINEWLWFCLSAEEEKEYDIVDYMKIFNEYLIKECHVGQDERIFIFIWW